MPYTISEEAYTHLRADIADASEMLSTSNFLRGINLGIGLAMFITCSLFFIAYFLQQRSFQRNCKCQQTEECGEGAPFVFV